MPVNVRLCSQFYYNDINTLFNVDIVNFVQNVQTLNAEYLEKSDGEKIMQPEPGLEPVTSRLQGRRSTD